MALAGVQGAQQATTAPAHTAAAPAPSPPPVLLVNGEEAAPPPGGAAGVLSARPGGAYTTAAVALTPAGDSPSASVVVYDWPRHLDRLVTNIELLSAARPPAYSAFNQWCRSRGADPRGAISALASPAATRAARLLVDRTAPGAGAGGLMMLAVVLSDPEESPSGSSGGDDMPPLSVAAYCSWVTPPSTTVPPSPPQQQPQQPQHPGGVRVAVRGAPRDVAGAKHCAWVAARRGLEGFKSEARASEVVLTDGAGGLVEGLVNNFAVIAEVGDANGGAAPRLELQTAVRGALPGLAQRRAIEAAREAGIAVRLEAPCAEERGTWREAFICNAVRGIQPVGSIAFWPDGPGPEWELTLPGVEGGDAGAVTRQLAARAEALREATPLDALQG